VRRVSDGQASIASGATTGTTTDLRSKGLRRNALGMLGAMTIGIASTAPAYSLAATIGWADNYGGPLVPAGLIVGFIPMLFVAIAYKELNRQLPDCGTTFTWGTKAFGPHVGWMGGWGLAITGVIFMANAGDLVGRYFWELLGKHQLVNDKPEVAAVGVGFIILMSWVTYRGIEGSARLQQALVGFQFVVLILVAVIALTKVARGEAMEGATPFEWSWFNPFAFPDWQSFTQTILLTIFIFWGWDAILAVNEETEDSARTPGRAALYATLVLLGCYLLVTIAMQRFVGSGPDALGNEDTADNVFGLVAEPLFGQWGAPLLLITVLVSTASSMQTTILPTARGTLAEGVYKALPSRFARVHPKYLTPSFSTLMMAVVSISFYLGFKALSDNLLQDTILSISLSIAFYYAITALSAVWMFRRESFHSVRFFFTRFLLPLLGGLSLGGVFVYSAIEMWQPDYGSTTLFGVGGVFVMGVGALLVGVVLMFVWQVIAPAFFRGETLTKETPVLVPDPD